MDDRWLDDLVKQAMSQGWVVNTKPEGTHVFEIGCVAIAVKGVPGTAIERRRLIAALVGAGLIWPKHRSVS